LEHDQFYGVAFMAVATAMAPDDYLKTDAAKAGLDKIRTYIKANPNKELHHRLTLAWAATKIDGLIDDDAKKAALDELKKLQRQDGGWNMPSMGPYVKNRTGKDNDINGPSDGYATGFATFILLKTGASKKEDANIQAALKWLQANQRESGRWFTASLGGSKAHYLTNVGSSFAILALHEGGVPLKAALPSE
jgi:squalene-hopene/tetraprenyl-beta-curcumene cyclase